MKRIAGLMMAILMATLVSCGSGSNTETVTTDSTAVDTANVAVDTVSTVSDSTKIDTVTVK